MKNIFTLLLLCYTNTNITAQIINIPDIFFKYALVNNNCVDTDGDGIPDSDADLNNDYDIDVNEALQVTSLKLYSSNQNISNLEGINYFTNLTYLDCSDNQITYLQLTGLKKLEQLKCELNRINTLIISDLSNLKYLRCSNNQLASINLSGLSSLQELNCGSNQLKALDFTGLNALRVLNCDFNEFMNLDFSQLSNMESISCSTNKLSKINLAGLSKLQKLICHGNQLTSLNLTGLSALQELSCVSNNLTYLDFTGLNALQELACGRNNLTSLDLTGLNELRIFNCSFTQITSIDIVGLKKLEFIICSFSPLNFINLSGLESLTDLVCSDNQLTTLDVMGLSNLKQLNCENNKLKHLIIKDVFRVFNARIFGNENLSYICCNEDKIESIKKIVVSSEILNCEVNSYCSFNPGGGFYTIVGSSSLDFENNGCDDLDYKISNMKFNITTGNENGSFIVNSSGNYSFPVQEGTHTITPIIENPDFFDITPPSFKVTFPTISDTFTQDFCITPKGTFRQINLAVIPLAPPARPGFDAIYKIVWENVGNQIGNGTFNFTYEEELLDYISASQTPDQISDGFVNWNFTDLQPFEKREINVTLNVNKPTDSPAVNVGDKLYLTASISDNLFTLENTIVGSYDPNDKTCLQGDRVKPDMVGEYVDYLIRFENTGNYPAENVVVKDIINTSMFDISTLQITDTSHPMYTRIEDNKVEFIFENIQLPFKDDQNDGYVAFKLKSLPSLLLGDSLKNLADIYFDYNFPIRTNEAQTTINNRIKSIDNVIETIKAYPIPVNEFLYIDSKEVWKKAEIYDVSGRIIRSVSLDGSSIDVSSLESGTYIVKLKNEEKIGQVKISKI